MTETVSQGFRLSFANTTTTVDIRSTAKAPKLPSGGALPPGAFLAALLPMLHDMSAAAMQRAEDGQQPRADDLADGAGIPAPPELAPLADFDPVCPPEDWESALLAAARNTAAPYPHEFGFYDCPIPNANAGLSVVRIEARAHDRAAVRERTTRKTLFTGTRHRAIAFAHDLERVRAKRAGTWNPPVGVAFVAPQKAEGLAMSMLLFDVEHDDAAEIEERAGRVAAVFVRHNGTTLPRRFDPDALPDEEALAELCGGGSYEVIGKDSRGHFVAKRSYKMGGPTWPFSDGDDVAAAAPVVAPARGGGSVLSELVPLLTFMGQMSEQSSKMMLAMMSSNTQTLVAMMGSQKSDSAAMVEMMGRLQQSQSDQQARFFESMLKSAGGGGKEALESFIEGMAVGQDRGEAEASNGESLEKTLGTIAQAVGQVVPLMGNGGGAPTGTGGLACASRPTPPRASASRRPRQRRCSCTTAR